MATDTAQPASQQVLAEHRRATVRPDKAAAVAALTEAFRTSTAAVLTEYRGLSVKQVTALRTALGSDTSYAIVKNTLTRLAAIEAGLEGLAGLLSGPTAVAFIKGEPVEAAKALRDYARANPALVVKGGVLDGKPLTVEEIRKLADLESREVLLAKMAGALKASLSNAVYLLNAPLAQVARLAGALQAKAEQDPSIIGGAGTPAADPPESDDLAEEAETPAAEAPSAETLVADAPSAAADVADATAAETPTVDAPTEDVATASADAAPETDSPPQTP